MSARNRAGKASLTMQHPLVRPQRSGALDSKQPAVDVGPKLRPRREPQDHHHLPPTLKMRPQLHSRRYHHTYNGARCLPRALWIRSARVRDSGPVYEILLCYDHNRACTIYRTWDDFRRLRSGLGHWRNAPASPPPCMMSRAPSTSCARPWSRRDARLPWSTSCVGGLVIVVEEGEGSPRSHLLGRGSRGVASHI